jgi:two-component system chemotaxis response regulator CheB
MAAQDIIVVGGSAGAITALETILQGLPHDLPASLFVVLHTAPDSAGALPQVLSRASRMPVSFPEAGQRFERSRVYVAPPDYHLLLTGTSIHVLHGPRENGFRPAIDPLFRSAAKDFAGRVIGVILSGALDDGTFGMMAIQRAGGSSIVQHPYEALVPSMPLSAIQNVEVDHIVRVAEIPPLLRALATQGRAAPPAAARPSEPAGANGRESTQQAGLAGKLPDEVPAPPSIFTCPECGGAMWEIVENKLPRFRCYTGHGFSPEAMLAAQHDKLEEALWSAMRVLEERSALHRKLAEQTGARQMQATAQRYRERAEAEMNQALTLRQVIYRLGAEPTPAFAQHVQDPPHSAAS